MFQYKSQNKVGERNKQEKRWEDCMLDSNFEWVCKFIT